MAGPISHTVFAEKALREFLPGKDEKQFIVGNLFPDIRYLKVIDRDSTHFTGLTLDDVRKEGDSFKSGVMFHSLIDEVREDIVKKHGAYRGLPDSHLSTIALKICEDMRLYPRSQNWTTYIGYLREIQPQEKVFGIPIDKIQLWHDMHMNFFATPELTDDRNYSFFTLLGFTQAQVAEIFGLVTKIESTRIVDRYLDEFYTNLQEIA